MAQQYPYNVKPQVRSPEPDGSATCLQCPPDTSLQSIIIDQTSLVVIKGWQIKSVLEMKDFFVPCTNYLEYELTLEPMALGEFITLNYGNIGDAEGFVPFIAIIPQWQYNELGHDECKLNYRNAGYDGYGDEAGDETWSELSRIFMLSVTKNTPIKPFQLQNLTGEQVTCKILIAN